MSGRFGSQALALLMVAYFLAGCSTLIVQDDYLSTDKDSRFLEFKTEAAELLMGFNPDIRFYSIGPLGIPLIPANFKVSDPTDINLAVELRLHRDLDFSFMSRPCLVVKGSKPLCSDNLTVSAVALYQDDGLGYADGKKRWHTISDFYNKETMNVALNLASERGRIDRGCVYSHYNYSGEQRWGYFWIEVTYHYKCEGTCPESLALDSKDLVAIEGQPIPTTSYNFKKTRDTEYRFIAPLGP